MQEEVRYLPIFSSKILPRHGVYNPVKKNDVHHDRLGSISRFLLVTVTSSDSLLSDRKWLKRGMVPLPSRWNGSGRRCDCFIPEKRYGGTRGQRGKVYGAYILTMPSACSGASLLMCECLRIRRKWWITPPIVSGDKIERFHPRVGRNWERGQIFIR